ncbi:MAG: ABC transporter permease subunit, partial [Enterococcus sp.]
MAETVEILQNHLPKALADTFYMVAVATIIGVVIGGLIGLLLFLANNVLFYQNIILHKTVGFLVNAIRSLPFLILLVTLIPFLAAILGDPYTPTGAAISLSIAAIPFFARVAEGAFAEVEAGILEASVAQGATTKQIVLGVIIPESLPGLIRGV